jgi:hypothetical protein
MPDNLLHRIKRYDDAREGIPGEHWIVLAAGLGSWLLTRRHPSFMVRTLGLIAGTALAGRAASGREGLSKVIAMTPIGRGMARR